MTYRSDTEMRKIEMLEALEKSLGVVTHACKKANVCRDTYYKWIREDPEFKRKCDETHEIALDFAESSLHKQIKGGGTPATIFYLKCQGKHRGYVEREERDLLINGQVGIVELPKREFTNKFKNDNI